MFTCPWSQAHGWPLWCGRFRDKTSNICTAEPPEGNFFKWQAGSVTKVIPVTATSQAVPAPSQRADFHWRFCKSFRTLC